jgi:glutaredoxin-like protein
MPTLSEKERQQVAERFQAIENPVKLIHFTQELECETCAIAGEILGEIVELSPKLSLEIYNFHADKEKAAQYGIDKVPATILEGARDYGVRFYGLPAGFEFATLLEGILKVSRGQSGLSPEIAERLRELTTPVHLEVLVTPTCPYCPGMVHLAHQLAIESDLVTADMVEATEFPDLVRRYSVEGVPKTVVNGNFGIEGAVPKADFVARLVEGAATGKEFPSIVR